MPGGNGGRIVSGEAACLQRHPFEPAETGGRYAIGICEDGGLKIWTNGVSV
jgi:hypothetical protein